MTQPFISKRQKIVYAVVVNVIAMVAALHLPLNADWMLLLLMLTAYLSVAFCLDWDLHREEWVVIPLYLLLITIVAFTWASQFAQTTLIILLSAAVYGLAIYGMLLTLNILNIATIRPIPLARAASTVLSMAGLVTSFGLFYLALINQPSVWEWMAYIGSISFLISWPLIWTSMPAKQRLQRSLTWSLLICVLMAQLAGISGFWPNSFMSSLFLSVLFFLILGIVHLQEKRLLTQLVKRQYMVLGGIAMIMFYLLTQW